jgi:hypothetical protein
MDFSPLRDSRWLPQQEPQKKYQVAVGCAEPLIEAAYKYIAVHSFRDHFRRTHGLARPQIEIDLRQIEPCGIPIEPALKPCVREKGMLEKSLKLGRVYCLDLLPAIKRQDAPPALRQFV